MGGKCWEIASSLFISLFAQSQCEHPKAASVKCNTVPRGSEMRCLGGTCLSRVRVAYKKMGPCGHGRWGTEGAPRGGPAHVRCPQISLPETAGRVRGVSSAPLG